MDWLDPFDTPRRSPLAILVTSGPENQTAWRAGWLQGKFARRIPVFRMQRIHFCFQQREMASKQMSDKRNSEICSRLVQPVAVVGASCRLPGGVDSLAALWRLLEQGQETVRAVPKDRWDFESIAAGLPDEVASRIQHGGFLEGDLGAFDPEAFGISRSEAKWLDPQHRLLLMVAWEAIEHSGIPLDRLRGTQTGVFGGMYTTDNYLRGHRRPQESEAYWYSGGMHGVGAGRVSYLLDLHGPCLSVDTACSSSLVAIHLACMALRMGECTTALAGGVSAGIGPEVMVASSRWDMLSPTGRCHPFSSDADGYLRAEGCGVVVLKLLEDAQRDGDRILAVLRGSAVNQDGRSVRLTAPSSDAQATVFAEALRVSGVGAEQVGMIEAHGTGTAVGDPLEFLAANQVYGKGDQPCALGSIKSNIGHTEPASGVVGLLKAIVSVQRGQVPATLHFKEWNPQIDASASRLFVPTSIQPWPVIGGPRTAAVSSYGVGGTNAHMIVEQAPVPDSALQDTASEEDGEQRTFLFSAGSQPALVRTVQRVADWLESDGRDVPLSDIAHTLAVRRSQGPSRAAVVASSRAQLVSRLAACAAGEPEPGIAVGGVVPTGPGPVFVFSGHGSQWAGMTQQLLDHDPVFTRVIDELEPLIWNEGGFSLRQVLAADTLATSVGLVQPVLFAVQLALTAMWRAAGVEPSAVIGHSMGEVAAAVSCGALSMSDGVKVICRRALLLTRVEGGAMAAVRLPASQVGDALAAYGADGVEVAVIAAPDNTVVSGDAEQVDALIRQWEQAGVPVARVQVDVASHSPQMDPILDELREALAGVRPQKAGCRFYTTVADDPRQEAVLDADYWVANQRRCVRFSAAVEAAAADGHTHFIEISAHPFLTRAIPATLGAGQAAVVPSLLRDGDERLDFATHVAAAHTVGVPVPWEHFYGAGQLCDVPGTAWAPEHHWISSSALAEQQGVQDGVGFGGHPLLGPGVVDPSCAGRHVWQSQITAQESAWLVDHRAGDMPVMPGAAWCEMALTAAAHTLTPSAGGVRVQDVTFDSFLVLDPDSPPHLNAQLQLRGASGDFTVTSRSGDGVEVHSRAVLAPAAELPPPLPFDTLGLEQRFPVNVDVPELRRRWHTTCSVDFGPAFHAIRSMSLQEVADKPDGLARLVLPDAVRARTAQFTWHPVLLDGCLQALLAQWTSIAELPEGRALPQGIGELQVFGDTSKGVYAHVRAESVDNQHVTGTVHLYDTDGQLVGRAAGIRFTHAPKHTTARSRLGKYLNGVQWERQQLDAAPREGTRWLVVGEGGAPSWHEEVLGALAAQSSLTRLPIPLDTPSPAVEDMILSALGGSASFTDVLLMPTALDGRARIERASEIAHLRVERAMAAIRCLARLEQPVRLQLLSCAGLSVEPAESVDLSQAGLSGLLRIAAYEHPEIRPALCDADTATPALDIARQLLADDAEDQVAWREGARYVARLAATPLSPEDLRTTSCDPRKTSLVLDGSQFKLLSDSAAGPGLVDIVVTAVRPGDGHLPLNTVAGTSRGPNGKPRTVAALVPAGPARSRVAAEPRWTVNVEAADDAAAMAASLLPYLTAHHAVHHLARVEPGHEVLIRGPLTPTATALRNIAEAADALVHHQVPTSTGGAGATSVTRWDVVFDLDPGDGLLQDSGHRLAGGGRHILLGDGGSPATGAGPNALFSRLDLSAFLQDDPDAAADALAHVAAAMADGRLPQLPHTTAGITDNGHHLGPDENRILIWPNHQVPARIPAEHTKIVRSDGAYLVTGGLGGLGLEIARWLARHGAGTVILNSRSEPTPEAVTLMEALRQDGCMVEALSADLAAPGTAEELCAAAQRHGHTLRGIIHAAAVVDDAAIVNVTPELLKRVWLPKATGAWLLHQASMHYELDWFVGFSSFVPQAGSPGQSPYAAASAWLDELMAHRAATGLPALGVNWGAWAEVGIGARTIGARGFETIPLADAFEGLETLLGHTRVRSGFVSIDLARWLQPYPNTARLPFYSTMLAQHEQQAAPEEGDARALEIITAHPGRRSSLLTAYLTHQVADVLQCSPDRISPHTSLTALGMDSMSTVQLRNRLQTAFGITIPRVILWTKPTVMALRDYVLDHLPSPGPSTDRSATSD
ncbi:SDR family NAD(P)-dependent oxidoreductase [Streptomyces vinaceus]|uniref:SDR family NAD(P)-dependent oxidoreductase n=1 Tax=Streptomyces vinaceus TaxID=1960 RepID=UPI00380688DF